MSAPQAPAPGASIDSQEFGILCFALRIPTSAGDYESEKRYLIAHIDAHAEQRYEAGRQAGLAHAVQTIKNSNDTASIALKQRDEAQASLARLVEGIEGLPLHDLVAQENTAEMEEAENGDWVWRADVKALLPAKANKPDGAQGDGNETI